MPSPSYQIPCRWALQISSLWSETPLGLLGSITQSWGSWMSTVAFLFPLEKPQAWRVPLVQGSASLGRVMGAEYSHSCHLLKWGVSVSVAQGVPQPPPGSGVLTVVLCLCMVACWSSCDGDLSQEWLRPPSWWHCSSTCFWVYLRAETQEWKPALVCETQTLTHGWGPSVDTSDLPSYGGHPVWWDLLPGAWPGSHSNNWRNVSLCSKVFVQINIKK